MDIQTLYKHFLNSSGVCTDTRKVSAGQIFFALKGPNFNGNQYALQALESGAGLAVVDEDIDHPHCFRVPDVLSALQNLALHHRKHLNFPFLGITGSNGKTTTKELIHAVLLKKYKTSATKGNLNNHIGVPLTLLEIALDTEIAVVEMGANHRGEIESYCHIALPTHALITNIGKAHLEGFGGPEGVKLGKSELYNYVKANSGVIFYNSDDTVIGELCEGYMLTVSYGSMQHAACRGHIDTSGKSEYHAVKWIAGQKEYFIQTRLTGDYNFPNVMAAICIGKYFEVNDEDIISAIEDYIPDNNRSQFKRIGDNDFILDAYNANPSSMKLAIENFSRMKVPNRIAILGGMKELGAYSSDEHLALALQAVESGFEDTVLVGPEFKPAAEKFNCHYFENSLEAGSWFREQEYKGYTILLKGSRGTALEKILD